MLKNIKKTGLAVILSLILCLFAGCNTSDTNKSDLQGETKSGVSGISNNFNSDVNDFSDDNSYGSIENVSNDSFDSNYEQKRYSQ